MSELHDARVNGSTGASELVSVLYGPHLPPSVYAIESAEQNACETRVRSASFANLNRFANGTCKCNCDVARIICKVE